MGELLQAFYVQLDALLEKQGVELAGYAVVLSPAEPKRGSQASGTVGDQRFVSSGTARPDHSQNKFEAGLFSPEQLLTLNNLRRLMSGDYNESFPGAADIDRDADSGALPVDFQRENLKSPRLSLGQSLAAQVVGLMIRQLTADPRLLSPVRQLLANVEPAFLRLGTADPSFFNNKDHPARRHLEAVIAKSLAFTTETDEGFADFMQDLQASADKATSSL